MIPVHLYGRTVDMEPMLALCRERGVFVIEDACQAHGARYQGRPVGSLGDAGCFSFYPTKNLGAWGDGGAVVTDDAELAAQVRLLRSHGEGTRHHHEMAARTDRLDALQAAILRVKLSVSTRPTSVAATPGRRCGTRSPAAAWRCRPRRPPDGDHVFHLFVVRSPRGTSCASTSRPRGSPTRSTTRRRSTSSPPTRTSASGPAACRSPSGSPLESCSLPIFPAIEAAEIERIAAAVASFSPAP